MVSVISGCETNHNNNIIVKCTFILFSDFCIFWLPFQRVEAKCPALPHSCTCTQDSIGPQGPPGPSVKTLFRHIPPSSSFLVYLHLLLLLHLIKCILHVLMIMPYFLCQCYSELTAVSTCYLLTIHFKLRVILSLTSLVFSFPLERAVEDESSGTQ